MAAFGTYFLGFTSSSSGTSSSSPTGPVESKLGLSLSLPILGRGSTLVLTRGSPKLVRGSMLNRGSDSAGGATGSTE